MVRHIVMLKLFSNEEKRNNIQILTSKLEKLPQKVEQIKLYEVNKNISPKKNAYDIILISEFENFEALDVYRTHPEHVKVLNVIKKVTEKSAFIDYEV